MSSYSRRKGISIKHPPVKVSELGHLLRDGIQLHLNGTSSQPRLFDPMCRLLQGGYHHKAIILHNNY